MPVLSPSEGTMDALIQQVGAWLISNGAGGVIALLAIGNWWLERRDRKDAQDKLETAQATHSKDLQAQADKLRELAEKWAALLERDKRGTR